MAQHHEGSAKSKSELAATSPYAGQQERPIKSLSISQTQGLLAGKGMEMAKAAELNGYPGPLHTLELAEPLALSTDQRVFSQHLMGSHRVEASNLGAQLVDAERQLDIAFATGTIDDTTLLTYIRRIGQIQAELRASHLRTHLQQTKNLTPEQVAQYTKLRGYASVEGQIPIP